MTPVPPNPRDRATRPENFLWDMTLPIITPGDPARKAAILSRYAHAGFGVVSLTMAIDRMDATWAEQSIADHREWLATQTDACVLATSVEAIRAARAAGRLAVTLHFQGTGPFGEDLGRVESFYHLGIRHALLAYNEQNLAGCGCQVPTDTGLTPFGRRLVAAMERVGMLVDVAHTGARTARQAIDVANRPVIVSHANARALCDHPRCIGDDLIRACAATGGVVGISGIGMFLGGSGPSVGRLVDHIDHVAGLVGPTHVGLGLDHVYDMDAMAAFVRSMPEMYPAESRNFDPRQLGPEDGPVIAAELARRGYDATARSAILGENWLRVCAAVWK
jgi:membrane dipeptidase